MFKDNYVDEMNDFIDVLYKRLDEIGYDFYTQDIRIEVVKELTDLYVATTGERPLPQHLDRLATYILKEKKMAVKGECMPEDLEFPFLSDRQYESRKRREASLIGAANYDTMRTDKSPKTRSSRIKKELRINQVK